MPVKTPRKTTEKTSFQGHAIPIIIHNSSKYALMCKMSLEVVLLHIQQTASLIKFFFSIFHKVIFTLTSNVAHMTARKEKKDHYSVLAMLVQFWEHVIFCGDTKCSCQGSGPSCFILHLHSSQNHHRLNCPPHTFCHKPLQKTSLCSHRTYL